MVGAASQNWPSQPDIAEGTDSLDDEDTLAGCPTPRGTAEAELAEKTAQLAAVSDRRQTDPHRHLKHWHDLTECWQRASVETRYHLLVARGSLPCYTALNPWW